MTDSTKKWIGWAVGIFFISWAGYRQLTVKNIAQEASGQQAIPLNASDEEKQDVALVREELQAFKTFDARSAVLAKKSTFANLGKPKDYVQSF